MIRESGSAGMDATELVAPMLVSEMPEVA